MKWMCAFTLAAVLPMAAAGAQETPGEPAADPPAEPTADPSGEATDEPAAKPVVEAPPKAAKVASALEAVDKLLAEKRWSQARDQVVKLLKELGPCDELAPHVDRLDDALRAATFEIDYGKPVPARMLAGKVSDWNADKRSLRLAYSVETPQIADTTWKPDSAIARVVAATKGIPTPREFRPQDHHMAGNGLLVHDVPFGESVTLLIKGKLPDACDLMPRFFVCIGSKGYYEVRPTWAQYTLGRISNPVQGTITLVTPDARTLLATDRMGIGEYNLKPGRDYEAKVIVTKARIAVTVNGNGKLDIARDLSMSGQVAFMGLPGIRSTQLTGDLDGAWLEARTTRYLEEERAKLDLEWPGKKRGADWWPGFLAEKTARADDADAEPEDS